MSSIPADIVIVRTDDPAARTLLGIMGMGRHANYHGAAATRDEYIGRHRPAGAIVETETGIAIGRGVTEHDGYTR